MPYTGGMDIVQRRVTVRPTLLVLILALAFLLVVYMRVLPWGGIDWRDYFRPASLALLRGASPYTVDGFFSPPWTALLLAPLAVLPFDVSRMVFLLGALAAFVYLPHRYGASRLAGALFVLSPPAIAGLATQNIDWLVLCGLLLPPRWGLFFVLMKPQTVGFVAIVWALEAWHADRLRGLRRLLWPVTLATLASFALFGFWPAAASDLTHDTYWTSLWPIGVPFGLGLAVLALQRRSERLACVASPLLAPHVLMHSWVGALLGVCDNTALMVAVVGGLWAVRLFMA